MALETFLNRNWDTPGFRREKLKESGETDNEFFTTKALQTYLNSAHRETQQWTQVFRQQTEFAGGGWLGEGDLDANVGHQSDPVFSALGSTDWNRFRDRQGFLTMRMSFPRDDAKSSFISLILDKVLGTPAWTGSSLQSELEAMSLSELRRRALTDGVDQAQLDAADAGDRGGGTR